MKEDLIENIKKLCLKSPMYKKIFLSFTKNSENDYVTFNMYENLYNELLKYNNSLKNNNFNPLKYKNFELLSDNVFKIIKKSRVDRIIKDSFSLKYQFLIDENIYQIINNLINLKLADKEIKLILTNKIAIHKNSDDFYKYLIDKYNKISFFSYNGIKKIALENEIKIIYDKDNILVLNIENFDQIKKVGSPAWCIYREESVFYNYITKKSEFDLDNFQLCLFDFNEKTPENESLIGITLDNKKVIHAYDKNDNNVLKKLKNEKYINIIKYIYLNYLNDDYFINKLKNEKIEYYKKIIILSNYINDYDVFFKCFKYVIKLNNYKITYFYLKIFIKKLIYIEDFAMSEKYFEFIKKNIKDKELLDYLFFHYVSSSIYNGNFYKVFEKNKNEILNNNLFSSLVNHEKYLIKNNYNKIQKRNNKVDKINNYKGQNHIIKQIESVIFFIDYIKNDYKVKEINSKIIFFEFIFMITKNKFNKYIKYIENNILEIIKFPTEMKKIFSILTKKEISGVILNILKKRNHTNENDYFEEIINERYIKNLLNEYLLDLDYIKKEICEDYFFDFFNSTLDKMISGNIIYINDIFVENLIIFFKTHKKLSLILLSKIISNYNVFSKNENFHIKIIDLFNDNDIKLSIKMSGNIYLNKYNYN